MYGGHEMRDVEEKNTPSLAKGRADRKTLLKTIRELQDSFFETYDKYEIENSLHPDSERSKRLHHECLVLNRESQKLLDLL